MIGFPDPENEIFIQFFRSADNNMMCPSAGIYRAHHKPEGTLDHGYLTALPSSTLMSKMLGSGLIFPISSMLIDGHNIMEFSKNGEVLTTRWNLEDLALWLRNFIDHMKEDPYPVIVSGDYAVMKDKNAREFDSDDEEEFDADCSQSILIIKNQI